MLLKIRPYVRSINSSEYIEALANGDLCVAVGYNGDVLQARDRAQDANKGVEIKYSIPKEGTILWFDMLAIPKDAPHPESAYAFINFVMTPEVIGEITNFKGYANANAVAQPLASVKNDPEIYPTPEIDAETLGAIGGFGRSDQRHYPRLGEIQDGSMSDEEPRRTPAGTAKGFSNTTNSRSERKGAPKRASS